MLYHHSIKGSVAQRTYILKYFKISWYCSLRVYKDYVKRLQYSSSRGNFIVSLECLVQQLSSTQYEVISADYFNQSTMKRVNLTKYIRFGKVNGVQYTIEGKHSKVYIIQSLVYTLQKGAYSLHNIIFSTVKRLQYIKYYTHDKEYTSQRRQI